MPYLPKTESPGSAATRLAQRARDMAEASDRWFVSLAWDLDDFENAARTEAELVRDSVACTLNRAIERARSMARERRLDVVASRAGTTSGFPGDVEQPAISSSVLCDAASARASTELAMLVATSHDCAGARHATAPRYPSGVVPVVRALERVVGEHTRTAHRFIDRDQRFWKLIELLELLGPPHPEQSAAQPEESGSPEER